MAHENDQNAVRKAWMGLLAKSPPGALAELWRDLGETPNYVLLRAPEIGSVMVRGRTGAIGSGFNLGEVTVTRCSIRLESGADGHAYVQGRNKDKALHAALVDGLMQTDAAPRIQDVILTPLREMYATKAASRAAKAAATKVEFFTMARGED